MSVYECIITLRIAICMSFVLMGVGDDLRQVHLRVSELDR